MDSNVNKQKKTELMQMLVNSLPVLRAAIGISQEDLANYIGVSRQTYSALEQGKRQMSWNTFLSLFLFFISNSPTDEMLKMKNNFVKEVYDFLRYK